MYSIDINLLNDRPEYGQAVATSGPVDSDDKTPLYLGLAFAGSLVGLVMATFGVLTLMNQNLVAQEAELDAQLAELAPQLAEVDSLQAQEQQVKSETQALAKVFNQIRPWSATLQDIRDRVPPTLQITKIVQKTNKPATQPDSPPSQQQAQSDGQPQAASPPPPAAKPTSTLAISGKSLSFGDINDFVLTLRKSPFLEGNKTKLINSERKDKQSKKTRINLVDYQLNTQIGDVPATELLQAL